MKRSAKLSPKERLERERDIAEKAFVRENARLVNERAEFKQRAETAEAALSAERAAREAAQRDAERYRWMRGNPDSNVVMVQDYPAGYNGSRFMILEFAWEATPWVKYTPEALDAAIDAARGSHEA